MKRKYTAKAMGSLILLTALTAVIIISSVYVHHLLNKDALRLGKSVDGIIAGAQSGDWDKASESLDEVGSIWAGVKATWAALIDHQEIDNIDETMSRLRMFVKAEETSSSMAEAAALKGYISHIPARESLTLENIL